jgi:Protein of unknown function (DUF4238)
MASHKNQHFVPRCHFRPFTVDGEGSAINVFNIDWRSGIRNAAVKGQCAGSYFYGEDLQLEKLLQKSEGLYASTLANIHGRSYRLTENDKFVLRHFCYLQHCRTEATARQAALFMSEVADIACKGDVPPDWRTTMRDAVLSGMLAFRDTMDTINDLKVCLIRNTSRKQFITSDNPAVLTNRWYIQNPRAAGLSAGVGNAGVLFFLPLTPYVMCVIYDGGVYSMPNEGGWIITDDFSDVDAFNQHQFLNCLANIYFFDWKTLPDVEEAFERALPHRPAERHKVITAVLDSEDTWGKRFRVVSRDELARASEGMVHVKSLTPKPSRWPSAIKWRSSPRIYSNGTGTGFVRRSRIEDGGYSSPPYRRVV